MRARVEDPTRDEWALCIIETSDGGYTLAGLTKSFGADSYDFWSVKVDSSGSMEWNKMYGGTPEFRPWVLVVGAASAIIVITVAAVIHIKRKPTMRGKRYTTRSLIPSLLVRALAISTTNHTCQRHSLRKSRGVDETDTDLANSQTWMSKAY